MNDDTRFCMRTPTATIAGVLLATICLGIPACGFVSRESRRMESYLGPGWPKPNLSFREASLPVLTAELPIPEGAEYVDNDQRCLRCHKEYRETFPENVHRGLRGGHACEACHGPCSKHVKGKKTDTALSFTTISPAQRSEVCGRCHEDDACGSVSSWRTSVHTHSGVSCTDCHRAHYDVPPDEPEESTSDAEDIHPGIEVAQASHEEKPAALPSLRGTSNNLGAVAPNLCYRCHGDMVELQQVAGPHQICGPNGFNCTSCHNPHGQVHVESRRDMCLSCHQSSSPNMAWHSSTHAIAGVACTDCHNPHPRPSAQQFTEIRHTSVKRPKRLTMSVQEPETCYKCHPKIFGMSALPSHHPIREGKMVCSDCHDAHGQAEKGLREPILNQVCYRCHAEKQGPFVYEHPPVTENCAICHEPHGTVTNNLLRQPTTFLCLRCHSGHRSAHRELDEPENAGMRRGLYADCAQCHSQIHGSDLINETLRGRGLSR